MPTILGLVTAGLTVVFQDFILAFFGWFVLMGKNGIRVGDWVEINGVGGEVVEIGLFRTALLETGNWTANGHPTGRRVSFINSFAIRGAVLQFLDDGAVDVGRDQGEYAGGRGDLSADREDPRSGGDGDGGGREDGGGGVEACGA